MHQTFFFHNTYGIGDIDELQEVTNKLIPVPKALGIENTGFPPKDCGNDEQEKRLYRVCV